MRQAHPDGRGGCIGSAQKRPIIVQRDPGLCGAALHGLFGQGQHGPNVDGPGDQRCAFEEFTTVYIRHDEFVSVSNTHRCELTYFAVPAEINAVGLATRPTGSPA